MSLPTGPHAVTASNEEKIFTGMSGLTFTCHLYLKPLCIVVIIKLKPTMNSKTKLNAMAVYKAL